MLQSLKKILLKFVIVFAVLMLPVAYLKGVFDPVFAFLKGYQDTASMVYAEEHGLSSQNEVDERREAEVRRERYRAFLENVFENDGSMDDSEIKEAVDFLNYDGDSPGYDVPGSFHIVTLTDGVYIGRPLNFHFTESTTKKKLEIFSPQLSFVGSGKNLESGGQIKVPPDRIIGVDSRVDNVELKVAEVDALIMVKKEGGFASYPRAEMRILSFRVDQNEVVSERAKIAEAAKNRNLELRNFRLVQSCQAYSSALRSCGSGAGSRNCMISRLGGGQYEYARSLCSRSGTPLYGADGKRWKN